MSLRFIALIIVVLAFGTLTTEALLDVGYFGILEPHFKSWGAAQVFADLVIVCLLACVWMANDAKTSGLPVWPFIIMTLFLGSFGPLAYLIVREWRGASARRAVA